MRALPRALDCGMKKSKNSRGSKTERTLAPGTPVVIESQSPSTHYSVVFEDDGESGYFYGLDTRRKNQPILAGLHIYTAGKNVGLPSPSAVHIEWSSDGGRSVLLINAHPHAVFDFVGRRGYCRTNFPAPATDWTEHDYAWEEQAMAWFA